jgi:flagellar biosynthetic protein FliO
MTPPVSSGRPRPYDRLALGLACAFVGFVAPSAEAAGFRRDRTPLPADVSGAGGAHASTQVGSGTGSAALHMLLGLAIVLALIFGLYKLLKRSAAKNDKTVRDDGWIGVLSSTPLAPSRSLHLVQVGDELVLVGSSEQSVTPIRVYTPDEARRLGIDPRTHQMLPPAAPSRGNPGFGASLLEALKRMTAR